MKRSEMVAIIVRNVNYYDYGNITPDIAERLLTTMERYGMLPPFIPDNKSKYKYGDSYHEGHYEWESENEG